MKNLQAYLIPWCYFGSLNQRNFTKVKELAPEKETKIVQ